MERLSAFAWGSLFATGLGVSGMIKPSKVVGFLDFTGQWDPTLAFVMGGALVVFFPAYRLIVRRQRPVVASTFDLPAQRSITWQLVVGAVVFGVGWAVSGFCPAAGIAALPAFSGNAIAMTLGMAIGVVVMRAVRGRTAPTAPLPAADF